jgi:ubiquinone/menaquinone biosynthesis C-methylase UbiE
MAFEELKERQSAMWGAGPFELIEATISDLHEVAEDRLRPQPGERWIDVGCGTGRLAELAARKGAVVTGIDLAPVLIETAKRRAAEQGLDIDYRVGDCERLDGIDDASFDVLSSTVGLMFAPDHEATARQVARVVKPGGRIGLINWKPEGGVGRMFAMMKPFQPPPPEGAGVPFDWGRREHVEELLGEAFDLSFEDGVSTYRPASGEEYWNVYSTGYGPTKTLAASLDDDRREEFHRAWVEFFETEYADNGGVAHTREYLLVLGTRR